MHRITVSNEEYILTVVHVPTNCTKNTEQTEKHAK
jgi:hypothetical protein